MIPGQIDIDECIEIAEACDDCPDPATCQAEGSCPAAVDPIEPPEAERWDAV